VPASQAKQGHTKLTEEGVRTGEVPPALTDEELNKIKAEERVKIEEARRLEAQKAADQALLEKYRTLEDIAMARDGRIAGIEASIQVKREAVRLEQQRLIASATEKRTATQAGKPVVEQLTTDIARSEQAIRDGYSAIIDLESAKDALRNEFAQTIGHFKKLKKLQKADPAGVAVASKPLPNMVSCQGAEQCGQLWERALAYVRANANKKDEISGNGLLIGSQKDEREDRRLTLAWTQKSSTDPVKIFFDLQCKNRLTGSLVCTNQAALKIRENFRSAVMQPTASAP
jgi:hypothetical protein